MNATIAVFMGVLSRAFEVDGSLAKAVHWRGFWSGFALGGPWSKGFLLMSREK